MLALFALFGLPRPAAAQLDPETKTPYQLRVVLHVEEHRALTDTFQRQLERQLGDLLRQSFGPLVKVQVEPWKAADHPILQEIERHGLQQALEDWDNPLPGKTHFLLLRFAADRYEIQSRQYDRMTGLCTGSVRRAEVSDRGLVARVAAGLVEQDFGVVATVLWAEGGAVEVAVKGGELGVPLKRWIGLGDVLRVVRILKDKERGERLEWLLLRVAEVKPGGAYRCKLFKRFEFDKLSQEPGVLGHRCLRVSARQQVPLRLRLMDKQTGQPLDGVSVQVRQAGFTEGPAETLVPRPNGLVVTNEVYDKAAFVRVMVGNVQKAQIPVLLLDDQPVVCRLGAVADPQAERDALLARRRESWESRILDGLGEANERVRALNRKDRPPEDVLALARAGHKAMTDHLDNLKQERAELHKADAKLDLRDGDKYLAALARRGGELHTYIASLEQDLKEANSDRAKASRALYARAKLLETQADYQEALDAYEKILADNPKEANVRADRDRLAKAWQIHSPAHQEARRFIYDVWPKLDLKGLQDEMGQARAALHACVKAGDRLTPRKMIREGPAHATNLKKRLETVRRLDSEDARAEAKRLVSLGESFNALIQELSAFLSKK